MVAGESSPAKPERRWDVWNLGK